MIPRITKKDGKKSLWFAVVKHLLKRDLIYGKRPQCNVPLRWILLNFLSSSACFKRVKGISKWWENYFFLQRLGNRCRSSVRLADKKISQIPDGDYGKTSDTTNVWKKRIFSGFSFNRIPVRFKDILLWQRPTTKRVACCYLWEASSFSQETKSVLTSMCFTTVQWYLPGIFGCR